MLQLAVLFLIVLAGAADAELWIGSASWSGAPDGAGNQGCGFGDTITVPPFSEMVTGFGQNDDECGVCYKVMCTGHPACSVMAGVTVTVADSSPNSQHFVMSGHAFGAMAKLGHADELRAARNVTVEFEPVDCYYNRPSHLPKSAVFPFFKVDPSATKDNFSVTLLYTEGWASWKDLTVLLANRGQKIFTTMIHTHGATWKYAARDGSTTVTAPMSMMVYIASPAKTITMPSVIPVGWQPGKIYYRPV